MAHLFLNDIGLDAFTLGNHEVRASRAPCQGSAVRAVAVLQTHLDSRRP